MRMTDFDGKTAYVTGGSMGIGLAIAERFAARGADVLIFARRLEPLETAVARLEARRRRPSQRVAWRQLDVAEPARVAEVMAGAVATFGPPDVLINNAGRAYPNYVERIPVEQFADTLRVNVLGCWHTIHALLPHLQARRSGYIVNVSSLAGLIGVFGYTDYCASKFAVVGFSEALRSELKRYGIAVSVLCPPDVRTPGYEQENETKPAETHAVSAGAAILSAEAVADALLVGMRAGRFLIIPGLEGRVAFLAKRLAPRLVEWVMDRQIRAAQRPPAGEAARQP